MPKKDCILNLPGYSIKKVSGENPVYIEVSYRNVVRCIYCGNKKLRKKDSFIRRIRHESIGLRRSYLCIKAHKYYCSVCSRYFNQRFPGIGKYQRASESLRKQVFHYHSKGVSQKDLARDLKLGKSTVERWYHYGYELRYKKIATRSCPRVLGLDEHSFNRKVGYATTFCDLAKHKIFDVVEGRSEKDLEGYLNTLEGKEKVQVVCIDLSSSYRKLIRRYFPNAMIVADRFHVIRLLNQFCLQTYQQIDPEMKYQRGLLAALRTNPNNLSVKRLNKRERYLQQQPVIAALYNFKQRLHRLLMRKHRTAKQCTRLIPLFLKLVASLKESPFESLKTLGRTLYQWR
ncbi:TPA: ISL3 family transposase, partial [Legionella pneumophila]